MKIIFVCTGNTCRSPMAEGYLKSKNIRSMEVSSRGLSAFGERASENSIAAMGEIGIDISSHISKNIEISDLSADKIICLTDGHYNALLSCNVPKDKLFVLGNGIADPYLGTADDYRSCRDEIIKETDKLLYSGFFTDFIIRDADFSDSEAIARLEDVCFSEPWSKTALEESMVSGTKFFVAEAQGKILGYIGISAICGEGYITNIAVFPEYRNRGVATLLINRVFTLARENNLEFVSLEVRQSNEKAITLYDKNGFEKVGQRKNFYRNPQEDAIIMTRMFNK